MQLLGEAGHLTTDGEIIKDGETWWCERHEEFIVYLSLNPVEIEEPNHSSFSFLSWLKGLLP
jgi:hypothetical protein